MTTLLELDGVSKSFGGLRALDDVRFTVVAGGVHGLMGANGAGKTTLFSLIAGNQRPSSGRIVFDGRRIDGLKPDVICRRGIARTFQIVRPFAGLSVVENIEAAILFGRPTPPPLNEARQQAVELLEAIGLSDRRDAQAGSLTLSARKRLEVARAIGTAPRLVLLDEVMAGLTPAEVQAMMAVLLDLKSRFELTILIIEHVVSALTDLSDRITVLHHGRLIADGPPADIAGNPAVQSAYFGEDDDLALEEDV